MNDVKSAAATDDHVGAFSPFRQGAVALAEDPTGFSEGNPRYRMPSADSIPFGQEDSGVAWQPPLDPNPLCRLLNEEADDFVRSIKEKLDEDIAEAIELGEPAPSAAARQLCLTLAEQIAPQVLLVANLKSGVFAEDEGGTPSQLAVPPETKGNYLTLMSHLLDWFPSISTISIFPCQGL